MFIPDLPAPLPIQKTLPGLYGHLQDHSNVILVAPPGTGKTSLVPLSLLKAPWRQHKKIILLEPRRVATRAAARQMSVLYQEDIGKTIGYRTRIEKLISPQTQIEVITYGLFLRQLLNNPFLDNVAAVIFDEIHERSLDADLCLSLCHNLQRHLRPDLRLIAMSATPSLTKLQSILECTIIENESAIHPLIIHHQSHDLQSIRDLPKLAAQKIHQIYQKDQGNILVFLPGVPEIHQTLKLLDIKDADIIPLYGDLSPAEQDRALRPMTQGESNRIILATSIAETSLTVPGVNIVIDGGFQKKPQFNADTGLSHLQTQRISKATALQRAGRAGRESAGTVHKLWSPPTDRSLAIHDRPEILESDLSEFLLICQAWVETIGISMDDLLFPDTPITGNVEAAKELLRLLGAFDETDQITPFGYKLIKFGSHPRLASMMLRAESNEEKALAAHIAALLEERDPFQNHDMAHSDIEVRLGWLLHPPSEQKYKSIWYRIQKTVQEYHKRLHIPASIRPSGNPALFICSAFPDRLAQRRNDIGSFRFAGGGSAYLPSIDPFAKESLLAVAKVHVRKRSHICLAAPLDRENIPSFIRTQCRKEHSTSLDPVSGKVITREQVRFGRLILQDKTITATAEQAFPVLLHHIQNNFATALPWSDETAQLQGRCSLASQYFPELSFPDLSEPVLKTHCKDWLAPWISHIHNLNDIQQLDLNSILESYLGYQHCQALNKLFPSFILLNHHKIKIDYTQHHPTISAPAQKFYGIKETPMIANGRISLQCSLLSPANRPQAITVNLKEFWKNGWKDMRKDMKGRYPKHDWPENPSAT